MNKVRITFLGAAQTVTGSATLLEHEGGRILIDFGVFQGGPEAEEMNFAPLGFDPGRLDAVVLTHAHLDHVGRLPRLVANGFTGPIITHPASVEIAAVVLKDALHLMEHNPRQLFSEEDLQKTLRLFRPLPYHQKVEVAGCEIELFDAGHILGSAHLQFTTGDRKIVFSGDIGQKGTPIIRDPWYHWPDGADLVVVESTYGDRRHKELSSTLDELCSIVNRAAELPGMILIPAFAIGRTQELLYHFSRLMDEGRIPEIPVILDSPMAEKVTAIYRRHRECYDRETWEIIESGRPPFRPPYLREVASADESRSLARQRPPAVIIAGSGMCTGGRILHHFAAWLDKPSTSVVFVGFQGTGTLGRKLIEGAETVSIHGQEITVRAKIETLGGFSAHAGQDQLLDWCKSFSSRKPLFLLNHGEKNSCENFSALLCENALKAQVACPNSPIEL
jgi:metallo-beta-lactamase family protein